ncbi:MAG: adenylate/guanylate cyclase domain-containing protein [Proteobacteria bacterium]|nr:adenylate/guanylate cyclase domain-containing protein [Pseudomonadota bacterium]
MSRDTFEVYYNQNGRWQLHASFEASQRDLAIEEAKTVEQKEGYATRVVRETFNSETNTTEDAISWQSAKAKNINDSSDMFGIGPGGGGKAPPKQAPKKQAQPSPRPAPRPPAAEPQQQEPKPQQKSSAFQTAPIRKPAKKKKKQRSAVMRFLIVIGTSAAIAIVSAAAAAIGIAGMVEMRMLPGRDYTPVVAGTFVLTFFMSMFVNLQKHFGILSMLKSGPKAPKRGASPEMMMAAAPRKKPTQDVEFDQVTSTELNEESQTEGVADDSTAIDAELGAEEAPPSLDADMGAERSTDMDAQVHEPAPEPAPAPQPAAPAPTPPHAPTHAAPAPEPKREAPPKPAAPQVPPAEADARASFTKFVGDVMRHAPGDLNTFSRFGLNLYVAGAGSVIGQAKRLPRDAQLGVVKQGLQATGMPADRAEAFCVELPSHGKNPKYAGMIQAGVKAMQAYLAGNAGVAGQIAALLSDWNLPEKRAAIPSVITFVFTDIVGSTAMTQRLGNAGAQKAVRAHNTAVRGAIQAYKGREVKHTGDGIMATFPDPPSAVAACIKIQREIAAHNTANPNVDVHLRIGINAGEAVEEENDFFGAAVQMTARICDKAAKDNIWVSQAVVDGCKGQKFGFIPRGAFEMKGIQGSKRLFEVGWSDAHKNELADL